jgi:hypothetical protein
MRNYPSCSFHSLDRCDVFAEAPHVNGGQE